MSLELNKFQTPPKLPLQASLDAKINNNLAEICELAKDVTFAQEKAQSGLHQEIASTSKSLAELKGTWQERHTAMSRAMDDRIGNLAAEHAKAREEHAKALEEHVSKHAKMFEELAGTNSKTLQEHASGQARALEEHVGAHAKALEEHASTYTASLAEMRSFMTGKFEIFEKVHADHSKVHADHSAMLDTHHEKHAEHSASLHKGLEDVCSRLQQEISELRAAFQLEIAEHRQTVVELKAAMLEKNDSLSKEMHDGLGNLAAENSKACAENAKALAVTASTQSKALEDHASAHHAALTEIKAEMAEVEAKFKKISADHSAMHDLHHEKHSEHATSLGTSLEEVHRKLQEEVSALRSDYNRDLKLVSEDVTCQIDKITFSMVQLGQEVATAHEEAKAALQLELAGHGKAAEEMKAALEEAHTALSMAMDEGLSKVASDHAKAFEEHAKSLEEHTAAHSKALEEHAGTHSRALEEHASSHGAILAEVKSHFSDRFDTFHADHSALHDSHKEKHAEHESALDREIQEVLKKVQEELAALRSEHSNGLKETVADMNGRFEKNTEKMSDLGKSVNEAQEEAHSALRLELATHGSNAAEMKAAWEEAHNALSTAMNEGHESLAEKQARAREEHTKALAEHAEEHVKTLENHVGRLVKALDDHVLNQDSALRQMQEKIAGQLQKLNDDIDITHDLHNKKHDEQTVSFVKGLEELRGRSQQELAEVRSALRLDLAEHGKNAAEAKVAWQEKYNLLSKTMDAKYAEVREEYAKSLSESNASQLKALEEASSVWRLELDGQSRLADEMKVVWEDAHNALAKAMDAGFSKLTAEQAKAYDEHAKALELHAVGHAKALEEHKTAHAKALEEHTSTHGRSLEEIKSDISCKIDKFYSDHSELHELTHEKHAQHSSALDEGLQDVASRLRQDIAALQLEHANNLRQSVRDFNSRFDQMTLDMVHLAKNVTAAQEEAISGVRTEVATHERNATEIKAAWDEKHKVFSNAVIDRLEKLAAEHHKSCEEHAKMLQEARVAHSQALEEHTGANANALAKQISMQNDNLAEIERKITAKFDKFEADNDAMHDATNQKHAQYATALDKQLDDMQGNFKNELTELRSETEKEHKQLIDDLTSQFDQLTWSVVQLGRDVGVAQEEIRSALRSELSDMKAAREEAHDALSKSLQDLSAENARKYAEHAETLREHSSAHAKALEEHTSTHSANLAEMKAHLVDKFDKLHADHSVMHDSHRDKHEKLAAALESGLQDSHGKSQQEFAALRSENASRMEQNLKETTNRYEELSLSTVKLCENVTGAQQEASTALRQELGQMMAAREAAHNALSKTIDVGLEKLASDNARAREDFAKALEQNSSAQAKALEEKSVAQAKALEEVREDLRTEIATNSADMKAAWDTMFDGWRKVIKESFRGSLPPCGVLNDS